MSDHTKREGKSRKSSRKYSPRTIGLLFGLSGNRCSHPDCINKIIEDYTKFDDAAISGHIAHIVGSSEIGPRSQIDSVFDPNSLDQFENLILLCRHHHGIIDIQPNTYTIEQLRAWKENHLRKHLFRRISQLPEASAKHSIMGLAIQAFTLDAKLIEAGSPQTTVTPSSLDSTKTLVATTIPYIFEFENGRHHAIQLINDRLICAIGTRVSILFVTMNNGYDYPVSIFNHGELAWRSLPHNQSIEFLTKLEMRVVYTIFLLPTLTFGAALLLQSPRLQLGAIIICVGLLVSMRIFQALRRRSLKTVVKHLQSLVELK